MVLILSTKSVSIIMATVLNCARGLPLFASIVIAAANYPAIPSDKTTPVQQRLAISGANCKLGSLRCHVSPSEV